MRKLVLFLALVLVPSVSSAQFYADANLYVWDFADRAGEQNGLTDNFTREFEEVLVNSGCCEIIERRSISRLIAQIDNERAIRDIDEISSASLDALKNGGAEIVVFGDVFDDIESGEIIVTVTYQGLGGKKHAIRSGTIGRGQRYDRSNRMKLVSQLVPEGRSSSDSSEEGALKEGHSSFVAKGGGIALAIYGDDVSQYATRHIKSVVSSYSKEFVGGIFTSAFFPLHFKNTVNGDTSHLTEKGIFEKTSRVLLIDCSSECSAVNSDMRSCDLRLQFSLFAADGASANRFLSVGGRGGDDNGAIDRALEKLAPKLSQILSEML